ncbi:hypothetical protein K1719_038841 [Acacia pycnantha]|nr:hypothetical protein K1719_038841 [Acacia pycnantha]
MIDPSLVKEIKGAVSVPIIARARVGHFVEAQILQAVGVDYIDESELLALADDQNYINEHNFRIPFVSGSRNLGEALWRIREGAAMIRTQGELSGSENILTVVVVEPRSLVAKGGILAAAEDGSLQRVEFSP